MKSAKVILSALAGVAVGVQIGLLIAPEKGKDTRKKLTKKGEEYLKDINGQIDGLLKGMNEKMDKMNKNIATVAEETKARGKELLAEAKEKTK
ncbi:Gas vesicle protein [Cyclobacterium xiamenense]|jgi:gas vesicle protein|uniref:Gas vesicle protein n=1 Tax=Cyclobacterium xiamenense TaxID=1297121 RepID=A0A1H7BRX1_9BACT|nr:YtxH domain-containing protein [Cyclobacterium xiamenense]SEJ79067.1 Gas vesicle protein [Cyclobacterium xiamenense]